VTIDKKLELLLKLRQSLNETTASIEKALKPHYLKIPIQIDAEDLEETRLEIGNANWYLDDARDHLHQLLQEGL
jgi:hypothetical protein